MKKNLQPVENLLSSFLFRDTSSSGRVLITYVSNLSCSGLRVFNVWFIIQSVWQPAVSLTYSENRAIHHNERLITVIIIIVISSTVISSRWATVDWSWSIEWNWLAVQCCSMAIYQKSCVRFLIASLTWHPFQVIAFRYQGDTKKKEKKKEKKTLTWHEPSSGLRTERTKSHAHSLPYIRSPFYISTLSLARWHRLLGLFLWAGRQKSQSGLLLPSAPHDETPTSTRVSKWVTTAWRPPPGS